MSTLNSKMVLGEKQNGPKQLKMIETLRHELSQS